MKELNRLLRFAGIIFVFLFIFNTEKVSSQLIKNDIENFFFDAVVFKGSLTDSNRIDCFALIPYDKLTFISANGIYAANYILEIAVFDSAGTKVYNDISDRTIKEQDYFVTKGGTAKFDKIQKKVQLFKGNYRVVATLTDKFSKLNYERTRNINVINFNEYENSMSGILLVSSIEELNGKFKITPHISDNIGNLTNGFFVFFEFYSKSLKDDSVDVIWEILNSKEEVIAQGVRKRLSTNTNSQQVYLQVPVIPEMTLGNYKVKVLALKKDTTLEYTSADFVAITQRSIKYVRTFAGNVLGDLNTAIKQLRYIAYQQDIDFILENENIQDRQTRFELFWKKNDPTPTTERNEAFDEYYNRVNYANSNFRSYTDGWLTDKGMVYITYGEPTSIERQQGYGDGKVYEKWYYRNNREFFFADNSGFGDFRLVRPMSVTDKYRFNKN